MQYKIDLDGKIASIDFDEGLNSKDLTLVQDMLIKAIENRKEELKKIESFTIGVNDKFEKMYPPLSIRTTNCLLRAGYETIGDVLKCSKTELMNIRNIGRKGVDEVIERFSKYGDFKEEENDSCTMDNCSM